jgi:hypothetical protein
MASQTKPEVPTRHPGLKALDKLVGTWKASGETQGELIDEWLPGAFFLMARGDTEQGGQRTRHIRGTDLNSPSVSRAGTYRWSRLTRGRASPGRDE